MGTRRILACLAATFVFTTTAALGKAPDGAGPFVSEKQPAVPAAKDGVPPADNGQHQCHSKPCGPRCECMSRQEAFEQTPSVKKLDEKPGSAKTDDQRTCPTDGHVFTEPAHFPLPQFKADECPVDDIGLVIYEGMRLSINGEGKYCVRFVASASAVPVTLRLQFNIARRQGELIETITLPPIHIPAAQPGKVEAGEYVVHHDGYAAVKPGCNWHAHRSGTARFGYGASEVP